MPGFGRAGPGRLLDEAEPGIVDDEVVLGHRDRTEAGQEHPGDRERADGQVQYVAVHGVGRSPGEKLP